MANRYWVGGTASWDATAGTKWALTSGGVGGQAVPNVADDVFFDGASGAVTVTYTTASSVKSLNFSGFGGTFIHNAVTMTIAGSVTMNGGMTYTKANGTTSAINFTATTAGQFVTSNGKSFGNMSFSGVGGAYTLNDDYNSTGTITLAAGTLDFNNRLMSVAGFATSGTGVKVLTMGAAQLTISGTTGAWNAGGSNLTINSNSATATFTAASQTFTGGNFNWNGLTANFNATGAVTTITGTPTITNVFKDATTKNGAESIILASNVTISGTFRPYGANGVRLAIGSSVAGTARTITCNGTVDARWVDFEDITAAGTASWNLSGIEGGSGDRWGNTGITFTAPRTVYAVVAGNWTSTAMWSTTSGGASGAPIPLPQDTARFDANSAAGTYTMNAGIACHIDCTGFTRTFTLGNSATNRFFMGGFIASSTMTLSWSGNMIFSGRGNHTLTTAGKNFGQGANRGLAFGRVGGTYTVTDQLNSSGGVSSGFNGITVQNNVTVNALSGINTSKIVVVGTSTLNLGSSEVILGENGASSVWSVVPTATLSAANATITISTTSVSARTFTGGGKSYGVVQYAVNGSTGQLTITDGGNTFGTLRFRDTTAARSLILTSSTTNTVTNFDFVGASGFLMTLTATTATAATLSKASGTVEANFANILRSTVTGGATWNAYNSTNGGTNTGWNFLAGNPGGGATTGQIKYYNGTAFVAKPVKYWNGTAWVTKPLKRYNGSAWVVTNY